MIFQSDNDYPDFQNPVKKEPSFELIDLLKRIAAPIGSYGLGGLFKPQLMQVAFDKQASEMMADHRRASLKMKRATIGTPFTSFWARRDEITIKLAMVHAIGVDPENPVITSYDINFASPIVDRSMHQMIDGVKRFVSDNNAESFAKRVIEIIRKKKNKSITKSELYNKTLFLGRERDSTMSALIDSEQIAIELDTSTGGRPKMIYHLRE